MNQTIQTKIMQHAAEQAGVSPEEITVESHFVNDLQYDSLDAVEFMMRIEDEFSISVPDEKAQELKTVSDVVDFVTAQTSAMSA